MQSFNYLSEKIILKLQFVSIKDILTILLFKITFVPNDLNINYHHANSHQLYEFQNLTDKISGNLTYGKYEYNFQSIFNFVFDLLSKFKYH